MATAQELARRATQARYRVEYLWSEIGKAKLTTNAMWDELREAQEEQQASAKAALEDVNAAGILP